MSDLQVLALVVAALLGAGLAFSDMSAALEKIEWKSDRLPSEATWSSFCVNDWALLRKAVALCVIDEAVRWLRRHFDHVLSVGWGLFFFGAFVTVAGAKLGSYGLVEDSGKRLLIGPFLTAWGVNAFLPAPAVLGAMLRGRIWLLRRRLASSMRIT